MESYYRVTDTVKRIAIRQRAAEGADALDRADEITPEEIQRRINRQLAIVNATLGDILFALKRIEEKLPANKEPAQ